MACIVSNERVLNEIHDSPGRSPASWVFPHVLKSPRHVHRHVISTPGAQTHWCMCCSCACGSLWCFHTAGGIEPVASRFMLRPKVQTTCWQTGDVKRTSEMLEARGRRRASGWGPNFKRVISHLCGNPAQSVIYTIYNSLCKFSQITILRYFQCTRQGPDLSGPCLFIYPEINLNPRPMFNELVFWSQFLLPNYHHASLSTTNHECPWPTSC